MTEANQLTPDLLTFAEAAAAGRAVVGGKAQSLGQLDAAGLPVPPGFVVGTDAYRRKDGIAVVPLGLLGM